MQAAKTAMTLIETHNFFSTLYQRMQRAKFYKPDLFNFARYIR